MLKIDKIYKALEKEAKKHPLPLSDSVFNETRDPFKVLVATMLSARTRDVLTEKVCKDLFKQVKSLKDLEKISLKDLEKLIKPVNFYKNKAKYLKNLKSVPETFDELIKLDGVGRKTANVFLASGLRKPAIGVDVHVHRISNRIGLIKTKTVEETEKELMEVLPKKYWMDYNKNIVTLGQNICKANNPMCGKCPIEKYCKKIL